MADPLREGIDAGLSVGIGVWAVTVAGLVAIVVFDLVVIARRGRKNGTPAFGRWILFYISLAVLFDLGLGLLAGWTPAGEFAGGYVTEYSLSVDNLFVFLLILNRFRVPDTARDKALFIGIVLSLVLRTGFILAGAAVVSAFSWVFYIFGAFLIYSGISLIREGSGGEPGEGEFHEYAAMRILRRALPNTTEYDGARFRTGSAERPGVRVFTPLLFVVGAIGIANVVFAFDSIPAIFGLTHDAYIVFTANAFALMGLRQLFFVIQGLLARLRLLNIGLSVILIFIGLKLVLEALEGSGVHHLGGLRLPKIGILPSLAVIALTLLVTALLSRRPPRGSSNSA